MKICFVALTLYSVLDSDSEGGLIGGAEVQQAIIARGLRRKGHEITVITLDHGKEQKENIDGLRIIKTFNPNDGLPGLRFLFPRLIRIWRALADAKADLYYTRAAGFLPAIIAFYAKVFGAKFVYAGAHDTDFMPGKELLSLTRDRILYQKGLRAAHAVIVQSRQQKDLLKQHYKREGHFIPNFFDQKPKLLSVDQRNYILWVASIREIKRPMIFVALAKSLPQFNFMMIGGKSPGQTILNNELENAVASLSNLTFLGYQPLQATESYFDQSRLFVNTSQYEGFPNTFLQAWRRGIPVITFFDPDGVVKSERLGKVVETESQLRTTVYNLLVGNDTLDEGSIRRYYQMKHSTGNLEKIESLLAEISGG